MPISRHKVDLTAIQRRFETTVANLNVFISSIGRTPNNLTLLASNALDIVLCGSVVAPDSPQTRPALRLASRSIAALFAVASAETFPIEVMVTEGPPIRYAFPPESSIVHPSLWLKGFFLAALCRDYESIQKLYETPMALLHASSTRAPEYAYLFVDAIRGFLEDAPDTTKRLLRAMKATDPERLDLQPDWTLYVDVPTIELFYRFAIGDQSGFASALLRAVELHQTYWSKYRKRVDKDVSRNPDGFLALGPLGMAALAYDRKIPAYVDSDYFPYTLVENASNGND